jgi:hypothetical protein
MVAAAFPYIQVTINTQGMMPTAQRSPGVVAIVGVSTTGTAAANVPIMVTDSKEAVTMFASRNARGEIVPTALYSALEVLLKQDPAPYKVYGVKVAADGHAAGLGALEGIDDITVVALAGVTTVGAASTATTGPTGLQLLKDHVERVSADGNRRIGVAMVDPAIPKADYFTKVTGDYAPLKSDVSRMVLVAARGATTDVAAAAAGAIAGYRPHVSMLLKTLRGVSIPLELQFTPSEIKKLSEANIIPIIDPALIPGEGLYFGEGRAFTTDTTRLYVDVVRTLDDIEFRLKAGLIGLVGDARITKSGLVRLKTRIEGILEPLEREDIITAFEIVIPTLEIVSRPESTWTPGEGATVKKARENRTVDVTVDIHYGPAIHRLDVTLAMMF